MAGDLIGTHCFATARCASANRSQLPLLSCPSATAPSNCRTAPANRPACS